MTKKTQSKRSQEASADLAGHSESQENVDKIRDILFGGQMRDYESRFRSIEKLVGQETARISSDLNARLDRLDVYIKDELSTLGKKLAAEGRERKGDNEEIANSMAELRKHLENRIADVDEVHGAAEQELRGRIHEQVTELMETIRNNQAAIENSLREESHRLGDEKVARSDLAGLLTEVAMRLQREFDLPEDK